MKTDSLQPQPNIKDNLSESNHVQSDRRQANQPVAPENAESKIRNADWYGSQLKYQLLAATAPQPTTPAASAKRIPEGLGDLSYDGAFVGAGRLAYGAGSSLSSIPAMQPRGGARSNQTIIYVNGINNNKGDQGFTMRGIADTTGSPVVGIHNATEGAELDLEQCLRDKMDIGKNPAVDTLTTTVLSELKNNRTVHLMGHSQGGLIVARALFRVEAQLYKAARRSGMSREDAQITTTRQMGKINVETFGAASSGYPDGPRYVHYINDCDNVPLQFGLNPKVNPDIAPGQSAVIRHFRAEYLSMDKYLKVNPLDFKAGAQLSDKFIAPHSIDDVYLKFRLPFNQARREGGNRFMPGPVNGAVTRPGFIVHRTP